MRQLCTIDLTISICLACIYGPELWVGGVSLQPQSVNVTCLQVIIMTKLKVKVIWSND